MSSRPLCARGSSPVPLLGALAGAYPHLGEAEFSAVVSHGVHPPLHRLHHDGPTVLVQVVRVHVVYATNLAGDVNLPY